MRKFTLALVALFFGLVMGCARLETIQNPTVGVNFNLTQPEMREAIYRALPVYGWVGRDVGPNVIRATLNVRSHQAVVDITYDPQTIKFDYVSSNNLLKEVEANKIHRSYNRWINNLQTAIVTALRNTETAKM